MEKWRHNIYGEDLEKETDCESKISYSPIINNDNDFEPNYDFELELDNNFIDCSDKNKVGTKRKRKYKKHSSKKRRKLNNKILKTERKKRKLISFCKKIYTDCLCIKNFEDGVSETDDLFSPESFFAEIVCLANEIFKKHKQIKKLIENRNKSDEKERLSIYYATIANFCQNFIKEDIIAFLYEKAFEIFPSMEVLAKKCLYYGENGEYDKVLADFEEIKKSNLKWKSDTNKNKFFFCFGGVYEKMGKFEEAVDLYVSYYMDMGKGEEFEKKYINKLREMSQKIVGLEGQEMNEESIKLFGEFLNKVKTSSEKIINKRKEIEKKIKDINKKKIFHLVTF